MQRRDQSRSCWWGYRRALPWLATIPLALLALLALALPDFAARAALAAPAWWDPDGVSVGEDWHYRVPVTLPATSSVNSTARVDIDFSVLLAQLGTPGNLHVNSVRVVRPGGALASVQEFNDTVFAASSDGVGNGRGEVRWIVQDGGAQTYYIYFDISANGPKSTNPQMPINGNFERGGTGQISPTGWIGTRANTSYDAQVRPGETVSVTDGNGTGETRSTNGNPHSGAYAYLLGARSSNEVSAAGTPAMLTRTIAVPATNPGTLTIRWKPQGWDSAENGTGFDYLAVQIIGSTTTEIIGPSAGNYQTRPFAPNYRADFVSTSTPGYGQYNGWDMGTNGTHTLGMTVARGAEPWWTYSASLAAYAGQTVTIRFTSWHTESYRTWFLIDDIEWSVVTGTVGQPQGFGAQVVAPAAASTLPPGAKLAIRARFDARPTAASMPATADVHDAAGTLVASGIPLFDDGTHGDAAANDGIWTNDGSDAAAPTYTIPLGTAPSNGWMVRVLGRDRSTSAISATNFGLIHRIGRPNPVSEANYWNVAEALFNVAGANLTITKTSVPISDPVNGTANPKATPGAVIRYCLLVTNGGPSSAAAISIHDSLPPHLSFVPGSIRSGSSCATATMVEDDDVAGADESDPFGASWSGTVLNAVAATLANGAAMAIRFDATVN